MTKEEALVVLKEMYKDSVRSVVYYESPDQKKVDIANALNVAIENLDKSLSAQSEKTRLSGENATFDCISREKAYEVLTDYYHHKTDVQHKALKDALSRVPSAQPEQRWIPCSERLPEENGRYLVTRGLNAAGAIWNRVYIVNYSDLMGLKPSMIFWQGNVGKSDFERLDDVIAWMPVPEPYGGEQ